MAQLEYEYLLKALWPLEAATFPFLVRLPQYYRIEDRRFAAMHIPHPSVDLELHLAHYVADHL